MRRWRWLVCWLLCAWSGLAANDSSGTTHRPDTNFPPAFSIEKAADAFWLVRPDGSRFFSLGVCCVEQGASKKDFDPANPAYAAWKHYRDSNEWGKATLQRLKAWGFTTIGGWSDFPTLQKCEPQSIAFAPVLHIGATAGAPWWDMWDPKIVQRMDDCARETIPAFRNDPRVIGYYSDNEIGWWNGILLRMTLEQAATSGQRQRLIRLLHATYPDWSDLLRDFDPAPGVENWADLERHGRLFLRPGGKGVQVQRKFLGILAERYYSLVQQIIRKYDARALILGDRYQSFYYPEVVRAARPYVDAISSNLNAGWNDGGFPRFYLDTLQAISGKPVLIGEFYLAAQENRSGNRNSKGVFPVVKTQHERAVSARNTLLALLRIPYVIGADWFQYHDEATHGRYDGENFNFGLVDIHNEPYEPLVKAFGAVDLNKEKTAGPQRRMDATHGVPPAPLDPLKNFLPGTALIEWDRERGFVPPSSEFPLADLYVCWNTEKIFLGVYAHDVCEDEVYRDKVVRAPDRAEWIVQPGGRKEVIRARVGAGLEPTVTDPRVRVTNTSGVNHNSRNIACLELSADLFGRARFKPGDEIEFASTFYTHTRGDMTEWKGRFKLAR